MKDAEIGICRDGAGGHILHRAECRCFFDRLVSFRISKVRYAEWPMMERSSLQLRELAESGSGIVRRLKEVNCQLYSRTAKRGLLRYTTQR
jgi:hypothetical protein